MRVSPFQSRLSNRRALQGFLASRGAKSRTHASLVLEIARNAVPKRKTPIAERRPGSLSLPLSCVARAPVILHANRHIRTCTAYHVSVTYTHIRHCSNGPANG